MDKIDIILRTFNDLKPTVNCIDALYRYTPEPFRLTIIDGSSDLTKDYVDQLAKDKPDVQIIKTGDEIKEYNQAINLGFEHTQSEFVVQMTSTIVVEPDWLTPLVSLMKHVDDCAVVQSKHLFPHGTIENAGIMFREPMMHHQNIGVGEPGHRYTYIREVDAAGFCLCFFRRDMVYPLETGYYIGFLGFDDVDSCLKLGKQGFKTYYCGFSSAYHYAFSSRGDISTWSAERWKKYDENRFRFLTRYANWGEFKKEE